ncbi:MAG: hypothetical protein ACRDPO_27670, partial [Streptosporangiaceae bacterium]
RAAHPDAARRPGGACWPGLASRPRRRRPAPLPSLSARIVAATAVAALVLGGLTSAAFFGALPTPLQRLAHDASSVFRAPGGHRGKHKPQSAAGPARGPHEAAVQCAAYARAQASRFHAGGSPARRARIRRELTTAAGGADRISAYCARRGRHPIAAAPIAPRHHVRCAPTPWSSWSTHPRPSWTPTVRPTVWPVASGAPTRHPVLDPTRCGLHRRWSRWRLRHQRRTGRPHSPSPSAPPRTGEPGHHRIRVRVPDSGRSHAPQSRPQARLGHTTARPTAHASPAARHAAKLAHARQSAQLNGAGRT